MIVRAWFLLCCAWAALIVIACWGKGFGPAYLVIAFAPLAVPPILALAVRFVTTGSFRKFETIRRR